MLNAIKKKNKTKPEPAYPKDLPACLAGDEKAWRRLITDYGSLIRRAIRWTLKPQGENFSPFALESDIDDVFQELCFRLIRGKYRLLATYDPDRSSFSTWLCVVARSAALDHLRNRKNQVQLSPKEIDELVAAHEEEGGMLSLPRGVLSPRQAYVLHLAFEKDADNTEIAEILDVHPQTVRSIRNSALTRLRWHYSNGKNAKKRSPASQETSRECKVM